MTLYIQAPDTAHTMYEPLIIPSSPAKLVEDTQILDVYRYVHITIPKQVLPEISERSTCESSLVDVTTAHWL